MLTLKKNQPSNSRDFEARINYTVIKGGKTGPGILARTYLNLGISG